MSAAERYTSLIRAAKGGVSEGFDTHVVAHAVAREASGDVAALVQYWGLEPVELAPALSEVFPALTEVFAGLRALTVAPGVAPTERRLRELLKRHASGGSVSQLLVALVARGVLRPLPLWRELGLCNQAELGSLMRRHFSALAARNVDDIGWKAFLNGILQREDGVLRCAAEACDDAAPLAAGF